jgi:hypothetical protein
MLCAAFSVVAGLLVAALSRYVTGLHISVIFAFLALLPLAIQWAAYAIVQGDGAASFGGSKGAA